MDDIDTFHIDGQVVVHTAIALHVGQLGKGEAGAALVEQDINQSIFLQQVNERRLYMTFVAIIADNNQFILHNGLFF